MNFSKQLKTYRESLGYSQEELAEKIYVTRQTISKWENDHTYPDIHNLIALSTLFAVTLDDLIKGDVAMMKKRIDVEEMTKLTWRMLIFTCLSALTAGLLMTVWSWFGLIILIGFGCLTMITALKIEKIKKSKDVQTFAEIIAFTEGDNIETARKQRHKKKNFWTKTFIVIGFTVIVSAIIFLSSFLWTWLI